MNSRFLIGGAIDEAAELHERADAAIVWLSPRAKFAHDEFLRTYPSRMRKMLVECDVPMKMGSPLRTYAVNPFQQNSGITATTDKAEQTNRDCEAILRTFDRNADRLDVLIKKQNTARFMTTCLEANGWPGIK